MCRSFQNLCPVDNSRYRLIFYLDKVQQKNPDFRKEPFKSSKIPKFGWKMLQCAENVALQSLQIFSLCYVRKLLPFLRPKVVAISARNTIMRKFCKAIFSAHYNIFQPNFGISLLLKGSFQEFVFCLDLSR